jgi:hypothetical protein
LPPLALSNAELSAVLSAAEPLEPKQRRAFLQAVAVELKRRPELGVGTVARVCRVIQRQFRDPPLSTDE